MVFRPGDFVSAVSELHYRGVTKDAEVNTVHLLEGSAAKRLPLGYDARRVFLLQMPLPRTAVYFRWNPQAGQVLTPDLVFQCDFSGRETAADRKLATETALTKDQVKYYLRHNMHPKEPDGHIVTYSLIKCQHCRQLLPLKALSLSLLREVDKGD
jgi:hypothetical protein